MAADAAVWFSLAVFFLILVNDDDLKGAHHGAQGRINDNFVPYVKAFVKKLINLAFY